MGPIRQAVFVTGNTRSGVREHLRRRLSPGFRHASRYGLVQLALQVKAAVAELSAEGRVIGRSAEVSQPQAEAADVEIELELG